MSLKVMVVDDDPEVLKSIQTMLEPLGCEILGMGDSREAALRLEKEKFDGIFLDVKMPDLDGFELTKLARRSTLNREVPVVMLTGFDDVETMRKGFRAGATCFLGKPVSLERLYALIKAMRGAMLKEKRRHARLPFRAAVKCRVGPDFYRQFVSNSSTISESGMSLESSGGAEVGQELDLEFVISASAKPMKVRVRVVRRAPPDLLGVEFLKLETKCREAIQRYVEGAVKL